MIVCQTFHGVINEDWGRRHMVSNNMHPSKQGHGSPGIFVTPVMLNAQSLQVQETYLFMKLQSNLTVDSLLQWTLWGSLCLSNYKKLHDVCVPVCLLPVSHKMLVTKCDRRTPSEARHKNRWARSAQML